jgi:hypothetical protein
MTGDTSTGAKAVVVARSPMSRIVGADRSTEFLLSARIFRADDADRIGLLSAVAGPDGGSRTGCAPGCRACREHRHQWAFLEGM